MEYALGAWAHIDWSSWLIFVNVDDKLFENPNLTAWMD